MSSADLDPEDRDLLDGDLEVDDADLVGLALFPLPDIVLLPGALMPLHIFEPRYREMTRDVLAGSELVAMGRIIPEREADADDRPAVREIVGVGRIIDVHKWPDGRYNLLLRGALRATIVEELAVNTAYRQIRAARLADDDEHPAVLRAAYQQLLRLCDQLAEAVDQGGPELHALVRSASSPGVCADTVGSVLITDLEQRQQLLDTRNPLHRLERVIQRVSEILDEVLPDDDGRMRN